MIEFILFFFTILISINYFCFPYGVPGSIQINMKDIFKYYQNLYKKSEKPTIQNIQMNYKENYSTIYGYCCRHLFNTFIYNLKKSKKYENKDINIGVSPIHHTSFRDIIENHFEKENIHIFDIDDKYENIIIPEEKKNINYDIIVITHLWGKYLNIKEITDNCNNTLIIEDVVLAGEFKKEFENNSDLLFHSCGMDKRPSSIFGGYVHIKNEHNDIIENMKESIIHQNLPTKKEIFKKLYDVTILYSIYNIRFIQNMIKLIIYLTGQKLSAIIQKIRKNKPGFEHTNYMKCPTKTMIDINKSIYNTQNNTEKLFIRKNNLFFQQFSQDQISNYFPWHKNNIVIESCLPYNAIYIEEKKQDKVINYFDKNNICIIKNPTYKTFDHSDKNIKGFLNNILYLPCLYNLNNNEIIQISKDLKNIIKS